MAPSSAGEEVADEVSPEALAEHDPGTDPLGVTALADERSTDPLAVTVPSVRPLAAAESGTHCRDEEAAGASSLVGQMLAHFRVEAPIGQGGMGVVYRGWDTALERPVALKVLSVDHPQARERFLREARAQAKVRHPNVVPIQYVGEHERTVFLSMDLIEGMSIADQLEAGPIPLDEALDIVAAVAAALAEGKASGLIHRDVKPSNVMRTEDGRVLLADFGLAKTVGQSGDDAPAAADERASGAPQLTHHGAVVGTPAYMAPEQTQAGEIDHRADMYALGVTLFEMVTGTRPFTGEDSATLLLKHREAEPLRARSIAPEVSPAVDALIHRLMQKSPAARFEDYAELQQAVARARSPAAASAGFFARGSAMMVDGVASIFPGALVSVFAEPLAMLAIAVSWALAEGRWGKTLGHRLFALRVVAAHGDKPSHGRALLRGLVKWWGPIAMGLVQVLAGSGVDDLVTIIAFPSWVLGLALGLGKKKLSLHDRLTNTRVVYDLASR